MIEKSIFKDGANKNLTHPKGEKGITLVALIITIIVLLILAVVAIRAISNDGIISHAKNARAEYEKTQAEEQTQLQNYLNVLNENIKTTVEEAQGKVLSTTANTDVYDEYGNKIVVPAGFKITTDANHVTEGIVIEDVSAGTEGTKGSQFVWVPVGKIYTDIEKTESKAKTIELKRYVFNSDGSVNESSTKTEPQDELRSVRYPYYNAYFKEELKNSTTDNVHAKDIEGFRRSVTNNKGYYIGRFEATSSMSTIMLKGAQTEYLGTTKHNASTLCGNMYNNESYISDLVNSYAWTTAVVFIQTFNERATNYSIWGVLTSYASDYGFDPYDGRYEPLDTFCNINGMCSIYAEHTTEIVYGENVSSNVIKMGGGNFLWGDSTENGSVGERAYWCCGGDAEWFDDANVRPILYISN